MHPYFLRVPLARKKTRQELTRKCNRSRSSPKVSAAGFSLFFSISCCHYAAVAISAAGRFPPFLPTPPARIFLAIDVFALMLFFASWPRLLSSLSLRAWFVTESQRENKPVPVYCLWAVENRYVRFLFAPTVVWVGTAEGDRRGRQRGMGFILALAFSRDSFARTLVPLHLPLLKSTKITAGNGDYL